MLFFGCRNPDEDFYYRDELEGYERLGLTALRPAFSGLPGHPKTYVQDAIRRRRTRCGT